MRWSANAVSLDSYICNSGTQLRWHWQSWLVHQNRFLWETAGKVRDTIAFLNNRNLLCSCSFCPGDWRLGRAIARTWNTHLANEQLSWDTSAQVLAADWASPCTQRDCSILWTGMKIWMLMTLSYGLTLTNMHRPSRVKTLSETCLTTKTTILPHSLSVMLSRPILMALDWILDM